MLTADEVKFLKELQDKLNTQETFCQATPRFWVVEQTAGTHAQMATKTALLS